MAYKCVPIYTVMILLIITGLSAQEARRTLLFIEFTESAEYSPNEERIILESLQVRLGKTAETVNFIEAQDTMPQSQEELETLSVLSGADSYLVIEIDGTLENTLIIARSWDILNGKEFFSIEFGGEIDSRFLRLFGGYWVPLERAIAVNILPIEDEAELHLQSIPGSTVFINGEEQEQLVDENGVWTTVLSIPASYDIEVRKQEYFPKSETVFIETKSYKLELIQNPISNFALKGGLERISFPHVGLQFYPIKDIWSLNLGLSIYYVGLQPFGDSGEDGSLIESLDLIELYIGSSVFLLPRGDFIRPYISLNFGLRFATVTWLVLDYLYPVVFQIGLGGQIDIAEGFSAYFEWLPDLYIAQDSIAAIQAFGDNRDVGGYIREGDILIGLTHFQLGIRIYL